MLTRYSKILKWKKLNTTLYRAQEKTMDSAAQTVYGPDLLTRCSVNLP